MTIYYTEYIAYQIYSNTWQRVERRRSKPFGTKHVSFAHNLVQDTPKIKSTPRELASSLKFGDFSCRINSSKTSEFRPAKIGSSSLKSNLNSNSSVIASSMVFGWLKGQLSVPSLHERVANNDDALHASAPSLDAADKTLSCPRCMGSGHLVRDCSSPVRCLFCFNYGHVKKFCLKRKVSVARKWILKKNHVPCIEPHTDATDGVKGDVPSTPASPLASSLEGGTSSPAPKAISTTKSHEQTGESSNGMANFAVDPNPYTPSVFLEDGGPHRRARRVVYITGRALKTHEDCVIAVANEELTIEQLHQLLHTINHYIVQEVQLQVRFFALHPHVVGIFRLKTPVQRDTLLALNPHFIGLSQITFYPHDEAPMNFRRMIFFLKSAGFFCWDTRWTLKTFLSCHKHVHLLLKCCTGTRRIQVCQGSCLRFWWKIC
jgi:hypothetical protein